MRYLIFSDIHGNDLALEALLKSEYPQSCDYLVSLGDMIAIGPSGERVVQLLKTIPNLIAIKGNHERYLLEGFDNPGSCTEKNHQDWVKANLTKDSVDFIESLPFMVMKEDHNLKILFTHYAMRCHHHYKSIIHNPSYEALDEMYRNSMMMRDNGYPDIICYGHEHFPLTYIEDVAYVNPGSLGCPSKGECVARAVILNVNAEGFTLEPIAIKYDIKPLIEKIEKTNMPDGEFIKNNFFASK